MSADEKNKPVPKTTPKASPSKSVPVTVSDGVKPAKSSLINQTEKPKPGKVVPVKPTTDVKPPPTIAGTSPADSKETIYVDNDDEITAIIDKVENAKASQVSLVLPKRAQVLQSIVNMRLLKRSAEEASKSLVLITNEAAVIPLAGAAGVQVAKNLQGKPYVPASPIPVKSAVGLAGAAGVAAGVAAIAGDEDEKDATLDYHRSMGELAPTEDSDEPDTIHLAEDSAAAAAGDKAAAPAKKADKAPKIKGLKVPNFDRFRTLMILLVVGLIALIVGLVMAAKILPKATINVQTTGTPVSANFNLTTSDKATALDQTKMVIPVTLNTKDQASSQSVTATGTQNNGTKATGSITMTSCIAGFTAPSSVSAGTIVKSSSGLNFVTQEKTDFKSAGSPNGTCINYEAKNATGIAATSGGANYNVASGTSFTVSGRSDITATGSTSGGTDNTVTVVAQADIDKAKAAVTSASSDTFSKDLQKKLEDQGLYVIASTLKVSDPVVTATPGVGQPASTVSVNIKITYTVLTVKKDDLKTVVTAQLNKQIDTSKQKILDSDVLKSVVISVQSQTSPTVAILNVSDEVLASANINTDSIKQQAANKKAGEIRDLVLGVTGVKSVDVKMSPFWVSAVPASKIKVNLTQVQETPQDKSTTTNAQQP